MHEVDDLSLHEQGIPTWSSPYKIPPYICLMSSEMNDHICIWSLGDRAPNIHICMAKPKWGNTGRQVPCLHARTGATTCNHLSIHACCCSPAATFGQVRSTSNHIVGYTPMNTHPLFKFFEKNVRQMVSCIAVHNELVPQDRGNKANQ